MGPAERSPPSRAAQLVRTDRELSRTALLGLALLAVVAVSVPVLSYRSDVAELRAEVKGRIAREARVHAEALGLHFELLQAELERLAARPEINLLDGQNQPEARMMESAHHKSALFPAGAAVLDVQGIPIWSEPHQLLMENHELAHSRWFQKVLALQAPVVDTLAPGAGTFVVAVPVVRNGQFTGVMIGLIDGALSGLPGSRAGASHDLLIFGPTGEVFLPLDRNGVAEAQAFRPQLASLLDGPGGEPVTWNGEPYLAAATRVGETGVQLVLLAEEEAVLAPARARFLQQLIFLAVLQVLTLLLFSFVLSRSYRRFLDLEARASQHQTLAALGSAASLIAHEVKNSLNGLNAAGSLLVSGEDPELPGRALRGQIDRLRHLSTSLLDFSRPATAQRVAARLDLVAKETVEGLKILPEAEEVTLTTALEEPIAVSGDPLLLATALDNLIRNAIEAAVAAKDLGKVTSPEVWVRAGTRGGEAYVRVEDNAGGPPPDFERTLFEPFVTSKPKGIGLGLSMARRAVEQQGGTLSFERIAGGSAFTVTLRTETT